MKKETLIPEHSRNVGLFLLRKRRVILSKSNRLKIVPEGKRKTRDENRNKYRKF